MATTSQEPEVDSLGHLEERIQKAVALVIRLRQEKEAALKELAESQDANAQLAGEIEELTFGTEAGSRPDRKAPRAISINWEAQRRTGPWPILGVLQFQGTGLAGWWHGL